MAVIKKYNGSTWENANVKKYDIDTGWQNASVKEKSENLFNYTEATWVSGVKDANGNVTSSTQSHFTDSYTGVKSNTDYSIDGFLATGIETKARIYFYDNGYNWISRTELMYDYPTVITTPANCKYVQFQCPNQVDGTSIMFVEGSYTSQTMPSYQPYWK